MVVTPDIQFSLDQKTWFSVFKPAEMMILGLASANWNLTEATPYIIYMRVRPDINRNEYTPTARMVVGPSTAHTGPTI